MRTIRYANDTAVITTNEELLQCMLDKLVKTEENYEMKIKLK